MKRDPATEYAVTSAASAVVDELGTIDSVRTARAIVTRAVYTSASLVQHSPKAGERVCEAMIAAMKAIKALTVELNKAARSKQRHADRATRRAHAARMVSN